ncbi:hypothetical protein Dimus_003401 [Dionaea muscipula]
MTGSEDEEVQVISERKGSQPRRRSGRIADNVVKRSENVKSSKKKRKAELIRKRKETAQEANQPVKTDYYDETFLGMYGLRREHGVYWLSSGENRRREEDENNQVELKEEEEESESEDSEKTKTDAGDSTPAKSNGNNLNKKIKLPRMLGLNLWRSFMMLKREEQ